MTWRLASVVATAAACMASPVASGQVFKVAVDGVAVDVLVTRGKTPVTGLTASDFVLRDNGVEQRLESVLLQDVPVTLWLVLDASGSVHGDLLAALKSAAQGVAAALRPIDRAGLVTFNHGVRVLVRTPAAAAQLAPHIDAIEAAGDTSLYDATFTVLAMRPRSFARSLVLVFSDGEDTSSWLDPRDVIRAAQRSDIVVHAVLARNVQDVPSALGRAATARRLFDIDPYLFGAAYLPRLVDETGGSLHRAQASGLRDAFVRILDEFRSRYVLTYVPHGVEAKGWHELDVRVKRGGLDVRARRGYLR